MCIATALDAWAGERGDVVPEWRFRVPVPNGPRRPLVPDVSYVSRERLRALSADELPVPPIAPDVAIEVLSPGDRRDDVADKIATYLSAGTALLMIIDPESRTFCTTTKPQ